MKKWENEKMRKWENGKMRKNETLWKIMRKIWEIISMRKNEEIGIYDEPLPEIFS